MTPNYVELAKRALRKRDLDPLLLEALDCIEEASEALDRYQRIAADVIALGYNQMPQIQGFSCYRTGANCSGFHNLGLFGHRDRYPIVEPSQIEHPYMLLMYPDPAELLLSIADHAPEELHHEHGGPRPIRDPKPRPVARVSKTERLRKELGDEGGWRCFYCDGVGDENIGPDGRMWHVDHVYPRSLGGDNCKDNKVLSCAHCNLTKNKKSAIEFQRGADYAS